MEKREKNRKLELTTGPTHFQAHEDLSTSTGLPRLTIVTQLCSGGELFDRIVKVGIVYTMLDSLLTSMSCAGWPLFRE